MLKHKFWSATVAAFACFVLHAPAFALPSGDSGYGTYVSSEHRNQIYERVGFLGPNITGLNNPWVNCPPDFRHWLPWVAYGGSPGGYIWYGCANTYGELVDVATDTMRNLMLGDLERDQAYLNGNVGLEFYLEGGTLFGRAYQTAFPVEENLGVRDEGDPTTCQEPNADGSDTSETSESFGNPVRPGAGNKVQIESDYRCEGPARLTFHRYYNSASRSAGAWGPNWSADYFQKIRVLPTAGAAVYVGRPSGRYYAFRYNGTGWSAVSSSVTERLEDVLSDGARVGWIFRTRNDAAERYDGSGRLLSITYRDGLTTTLNYDAQGRLSFVEGPMGHRLNFQYNEKNRVVAMTNPAGTSFAYAYDGSENLSLVTYPDTSTRKYHYEEPSTAFANALTGISDENGVRFATWSYLEADDSGRNPSRPISSAHAGGVEQYSAQYNSRALFNWDSAAVTDPLGVPRTYTFGTFGGRRKTVSIVGPPCPSCGPPSTSYDDNGYAISTTDSNGNVTMRPVCAVALNLDDSMLANGINDIPGLWRGTTAAMVAGACSTAKAVHVRT